MKKLKIVLFLLLTAGIIGFAVYYYVMHSGERDLSNEKTDFAVTSKQIIEEFSTNPDASNNKYLEKAVAISGIITESNINQVILDNTIICTLKSPIASLKKNQEITIKGRVVGYDDLMGELKLDQCFINQN